MKVTINLSFITFLDINSLWSIDDTCIYMKTIEIRQGFKMNITLLGLNDGETALVQIMDCHQIGDMPLSKPKMFYSSDKSLCH